MKHVPDSERGTGKQSPGNHDISPWGLFTFTCLPSADCGYISIFFLALKAKYRVSHVIDNQS